MSSQSLLANKYFDKLYVNRLQAKNILSNNILETTEQKVFLFSVLFNKAEFLKNENGYDANLKFDKQDIKNIIKFTDRPFRQTDNNFQ